MDIKVVVNNNKIEVIIDDLTHLSIKQDSFIGYQSWIAYNQSNEEFKEYCIEYYTKTNTILTRFNNKNRWTKILKCLSNSNLYNNIQI